MDYEEMIAIVQGASKENIKKFIFETDQDSMKQISDMELDPAMAKPIYDILKNRTYFEMLLVNALVK